MKKARDINYIHLSDYITWNDYNLVTKELSQLIELDVLYDNGRFFKFAILENNYEIFEALLKYFKENQLNKYEINSEEYNNLNNQLIEILENAIDGVDISPEMQQVLSPYINFDNSFEYRQNDSFLKDIDLPIERENGEVFNQKVYDNTFLTESVLKSLEGKDSPTYTVSTHDDYNHTNNHAEEHAVHLSGEHVS